MMRALRCVAALALTGCATRPAVQATHPPAWALQAEGEGPDLASAQAAALADLATQLRARVVSRTTRTLEGRVRAGRILARASVVQSTELLSALDQDAHARRLSIHRDGAGGRVRVVLQLDRLAYGAGRRLGRVALDGVARSALARAGDDPVEAWRRLRRGVEAARRSLEIELEASSVDGRRDALPGLARRLALLEANERRAAQALSVEVSIEGEAALTADVQAACAQVFSPRAPRRLQLRGTVQRRTFQERDLTFAESQARLELRAGGATLESIVVPGSSTRQADTGPDRAGQRSERVLRRLLLQAVNDRIR